MDDTKAPEGIDFFDFLYEIWQAKWMFAFIVIACTALSATPLLFSSNRPTITTKEESIAEFGFTMLYYNDPYARDGGEILADIVGLVDADNKIGLNFSGIVNFDTAEKHKLYAANHDRSYSIRLFDQGNTGWIQNNAGWIILNIRDGDEALNQSIHDEFMRAAEKQFQQAKKYSTNMVARWEASLSNPIYVIVPANVMNALQFLETPSVQDGSFRFFEFEPLDSRTAKTSITTAGGGRSALRMIVLGAIIGFILACIAIMFRIAINRKKVAVAKAG